MKTNFHSFSTMLQITLVIVCATQTFPSFALFKKMAEKTATTFAKQSTAMITRNNGMPRSIAQAFTTQATSTKTTIQPNISASKSENIVDHSTEQSQSNEEPKESLEHWEIIGTIGVLAGITAYCNNK